MKTLIVLLIIIALGIGGFYLWDTPRTVPDDSGMETAEEVDTSSGMRAEENMVIVMEQKPGTSVVGSVHLAAPGYLVIHEDLSGAPGAVIGASALLPAGESNVIVTTSRPMREGEKLHAMLHFEKGGNASFSAAEDTPVPSALGGPIEGWFEVTSEASGQTPITI